MKSLVTLIVLLAVCGGFMYYQQYQRNQHAEQVYYDCMLGSAAEDTNLHLAEIDAHNCQVMADNIRKGQ